MTAAEDGFDAERPTCLCGDGEYCDDYGSDEFEWRDVATAPVLEGYL